MKATALDFEYSAPPGEIPRVVSLVTFDGTTIRRYWMDDLGNMNQPPPELLDVTLITWFGTAELGCYLSLGWDMPEHILDMHAHYKQEVNLSYRKPKKHGLIDALKFFKLKSGDPDHKKIMRDVIIYNYPNYTAAQRADILDYNQEDVEETWAIFQHERNKFRGVYLKRLRLWSQYLIPVAKMEYRGIPLDSELLDKMRTEWWKVKEYFYQNNPEKYDLFSTKITISTKQFDLWCTEHNLSKWTKNSKGKHILTRVALDNMKNIYPGYVGDLTRVYSAVHTSDREYLIPRQSSYHFLRCYRIDRGKAERFIFKNNLQAMWTRTKKGAFSIGKDAWSECAKIEEFTDLKAVVSMLTTVNFNRLPVGVDGRNRCVLSPYGTKTSRHAWSTNKYIFGLPRFARFLIRPPKGKVLVEIDFRSQEFGIAAYLSKDPNMIAAYSSGDPYLSFGKQVGYIPENGTKETHGDRRGVMKTVILGCQYGMAEASLARRLDTMVSEARRRLTQHKRIYRKYWGFVDNYINQARSKEVSTALGWKIKADSQTKPRTIGNFPTQGSGSDVLRVAVLNLDETGFELIGVIHDAAVFLMDDEHLEANIEQAKEIMRWSSKSVIGGIIEVDAYILRPEKNWLEGVKASFWEEVLDCFEPDDKVKQLKEYLK